MGNNYTKIKVKRNRFCCSNRECNCTEILGIDEFKLHDGYKYATIIVDMATGYILWILMERKSKLYMTL